MHDTKRLENLIASAARREHLASLYMEELEETPISDQERLVQLSLKSARLLAGSAMVAGAIHLEIMRLTDEMDG